MTNKIEISHKTILFTVFFLLFLWFIFQIKDILFFVFIAFILMSALKPIVEFLEKIFIPRVFSIIIIYILSLLFIGFSISSFLPVLINQTINLFDNLFEFLKNTFPFLTLDSQIIGQQITPIGQNIVKVTFGFFNNIVVSFTIFVISFYLLIERKNLESYLSGLFSHDIASKSVSLLQKVEERLGAYVRGQLALGLIIGLATYIGLVLLRIQYAIPLALFAGVLEIIPTIGPIISAIPAVLISLAVSPFFALITVFLYFIIQQLENQLVVPLVMKQVVGLPPLVTIVSILVGGKIAGIGGALLAVPVVLTIETVLTSLISTKSKDELNK
jgi:predicted PurR-regulated permease PerM